MGRYLEISKRVTAELRTARTALYQELTDGTSPPSTTPVITPWNDQKIWEAIQLGFSVKVWSRTLQAWVYWVKDDQIKAALINQGVSIAIYTLTELQAIISDSWSIEQLRKIHMAKEILGGTIQ